MPVPYFGQNFPKARSGGGGFASRFFGGIADIQRMRVGHELTKDLMYERAALDTATGMVKGQDQHELDLKAGEVKHGQNIELENIKTENVKGVQTHITGEMEKRSGTATDHAIKKSKAEKRHKANADIRTHKARNKSDIESLKTMSSLAQNNPEHEDGFIDPNVVLAPGKLQARGQGFGKLPKPDKTEGGN